MIREILINPDKKLRRISQAVDLTTLGTAKMKKLICDMKETMLVKDGLGLAAPQIDVPLRIITINTKDGVIVFINPEIIQKSIGKESEEEGCLSVPGIYAKVKRSKKILLKVCLEDGESAEIEAKGLMARVFQHEIDHLDGVLFIDKQLKKLCMILEKNKRIKVVYFGSAEFSLPILKALVQNFSVLACVTEQDKPAQRGNKVSATPVKLFANEQALLCLQPEKVKNNSDLFNRLKSLKADVFVVAAYGKILPAEILNMPRLACLNVHPSLLPYYRGASPIQTALLNGDVETGVSIIVMDEGMDSGDVLWQEKVLLDKSENYNFLSERLSLLAAEILVKNLPNYISGLINPQKQDDSAVSFCQKIEKQDGRVNWQDSAEEIYNQLRAYSDWPGLYTLFKGQKLDIIKAEVVFEDLEEPVGKIIKKDGRVVVVCGKGLLALNVLKLAGRKEVKIVDFLNGQRDFVGTVLE